MSVNDAGQGQGEPTAKNSSKAGAGAVGKSNKSVATKKAAQAAATVIAKAAGKSVAKEGAEIQLASDMIRLGARLQVLQAETSLSYDRLSRLYREIRGCSPPKGMLPFSVDWFMTWLPNIHSSMFYGIYRYLETHTPSKQSSALIEAYRLYLEQASAGRPADVVEEPVLSFTRAWMLLRFVDSGMIQLSHCTRCTGGFVAHAHDPQHNFVCAICKPPPRAGKTRSRRTRVV